GSLRPMTGPIAPRRPARTRSRRAPAGSSPGRSRRTSWRSCWAIAALRCGARAISTAPSPTSKKRSALIRILPRRYSGFRRAMVWAYNRNDVERALTDLDQAIVLDPGSAKAFFQRGLLHSRKGDADHAIADLEETIRLGPNNADAFFQRGRVYGDKK